ncbi:NUDIX domain-containing protein [Candidatus Peregrinibacteria bacterium]|nr:NUDIX domain-containing protein [Candidatus Peregrinibacteria bacterium]
MINKNSAQNPYSLDDHNFPCLTSTPVNQQVFPGYPDRLPVPENLVRWQEPFPGYYPAYYTSSRILAKPGADSEDISTIDFKTRLTINRKPYLFDKDGYPLNPNGRTGLRGRGACKFWGPIESADSMITRYNPENQQIEILLIEREDNNTLAFPGGKVDPGESFTRAALRELSEEALDFDPQNPPFYLYNDDVIFEGISSDPRNTDNAWYESRTYHHHLLFSRSKELTIRAGSDANFAAWYPASDQLFKKMFAGHGEIARFGLYLMHQITSHAIDRETNQARQAIHALLGPHSDKILPIFENGGGKRYARRIEISSEHHYSGI